MDHSGWRNKRRRDFTTGRDCLTALFITQFLWLECWSIAVHLACDIRNWLSALFIHLVYRRHEDWNSQVFSHSCCLVLPSFLANSQSLVRLPITRYAVCLFTPHMLGWVDNVFCNNVSPYIYQILWSATIVKISKIALKKISDSGVSVGQRWIDKLKELVPPI